MFSFRSLFAGAKTPLQRKTLAYKSTLNRCFLSYERHAATALPTNCHSSRGAFVSVVSALRVHFLTFIDNYPISQRSNTTRIRFRCFRARGIQFAAFVPVVCGRSLYLGAKLRPLNQLTKQFAEKV